MTPSRAYLGRFSFKGNDQQKRVGSLSGGERGRLHSAKTPAQGGNVLMVDEASNDLDVETLRTRLRNIHRPAAAAVSRPPSQGPATAARARGRRPGAPRARLRDSFFPQRRLRVGKRDLVPATTLQVSGRDAESQIESRGFTGDRQPAGVPQDLNRGTRLPSLMPFPWRPAVAATGVLAAAGLAMAALIHVSSNHLLERDAESTALAWAHFVGESVPDLDAIFAGQGMSDRARADLLRFRNVQEVFRFKLFDRNGQVLIVSDDLARPPTHDPQKVNVLGHGNEHVLRMVLGGSNSVELKDGTDKPDRPALFSEAYVPVKRDGQLVGVVEVYVDQVERARRIRAGFGIVAAGVATLLGAVGLAFGWFWSQRRKAERLADERLRYLARHDVLSGLLNRTGFNEALTEASWRHAGGGPAFSVLCIDLDHFQEVNDSKGHAAGDEVLCQVGERLRALARPGDHVARLGGDEFALLQTGVATADAVTTFAERVVELLGRPYDVGGEPLASGCSVGVAIFGVDASNVADLMQKADLAVYRAKVSGRHTFSFYDAELDRRLEARRELTQDLSAAIGTPQMKLHYQPLFTADRCEITGYEALLRWNHPTRGPQSPAEFVALAEETGFIDRLGRWVLGEACMQAKRWPEKLTVAVNLSPAQFASGDLVETVGCALESSGLAADRLELEITESLLMHNTDHVVETLKRLAAMGVRIAMDDFGTGYSSLAYLWRFPFDKVKIDRAFTLHLDSDPKVDLIVKSIISLAHSLGIRVNAEGVENPAQMQALRRHGCDELQGYLLGRPSSDDRLPHSSGGDTAASGTPSYVEVAA